MKKDKIIYWVSTGIIALFIIPGIFFLNTPMALEGTKHLGLPMWFHWELGIAKFVAGVLIILPFTPKLIKEWAYVGLGIDFISATIALIAVDGVSAMAFFPLFILVILVISYIYYHKLNSNNN
jgi:hypothetical protein